jgi:hypothetical protein
MRNSIIHKLKQHCAWSEKRIQYDNNIKQHMHVYDKIVQINIHNTTHKCLL